MAKQILQIWGWRSEKLVTHSELVEGLAFYIENQKLKLAEIKSFSEKKEERGSDRKREKGIAESKLFGRICIPIIF